MQTRAVSQRSKLKIEAKLAGFWFLVSGFWFLVSGFLFIWTSIAQRADKFKFSGMLETGNAQIWWLQRVVN